MAKKKSTPTIELLKELLGRRVVSYHPIYAKAFGSVQAAIFLSQGFFWQFEAEHITFKTIDGKAFFDKTVAQWHEATGLTEEQQKTARKTLIQHGVVREKKAGSPAKLYYFVDLESLVAVLNRYKETGKCLSVDNRHKKRELTRTSDGKFRQLEAVNNGDINKEEINGDKEETKRESKKLATLDTPPTPSKKSEPLEEETLSSKNIQAAAAQNRQVADAAAAAAEVSKWAQVEQQTVISWYELARRKFTLNDFELLTIKFCGFYANHSDTGKRQRFLFDPVLFFRNQFVSWLSTENRLAPNNHPAPAATSAIHSKTPRY
jgi:hypothetical protein